MGTRKTLEAFERYYATIHIPHAEKHMPNVRGAQNARVVGTPDGGGAAYYRISHLDYDDLAALREGIGSKDGRSTIADLANFATGGASLLVVEDD